VSASLDSLRDHSIDACGRRCLCLCLWNGSNLDQHLEAARVRLFDERCRVAPKQDDRGRSLLSRGPKLGREELPVLVCVPCQVFRDDDVDPEWATCQCTRSLELGSDRVGYMPLAPRTPNPPALETAATSSARAPAPNPTERTG
jgi:hypothetical protein